MKSQGFTSKESSECLEILEGLLVHYRVVIHFQRSVSRHLLIVIFLEYHLPLMKVRKCVLDFFCEFVEKATLFIILSLLLAIPDWYRVNFVFLLLYFLRDMRTGSHQHRFCHKSRRPAYSPTESWTDTQNDVLSTSQRCPFYELLF